MKTCRVTTAEAARILGISKSQLCNIMKYDAMNGTKRLPIGTAIPPGAGKKNYQFLIYKNLVLKQVGLDEWPE